ncbi:hypothetical protein [Mycolicibacterium komossense]|uniref:Uncharacterized protein n=1 Tax=Mycolicibacterium komossense TaxID=1779 RepID=A0ABT3CDK2_9MYCO|nr:hypothetical protein [Mycolicibacterium komossense]MCV7227564.1 hypothetical protein [Mycolicibacterium komossense]
MRHKRDEIDVRYPSLGRWLQYSAVALLVLFTIGIVIYALQAASGR